MASPEFAFDAPDAIKFHVPFDWGNLRVTHEAAADYLLTPFCENVQEGDAPAVRRKPPFANTTVTIAGVNEITAATEIDAAKFIMDSDQFALVASVKADFKNSTMKINTGFLKTVRLALRDIEMDEDSWLNDKGVPIDEQRLSQIMAHMLAYRVGERSGGGYSTLEQANNTRRHKSHTIQSPILFSGIIAFQAIPNILSAPTAASYTALALGSVAAIAGNSMLLQLEEKYFRQRMSTLPERSMLYSCIVAEDIHDTFCSKTFDRQMEERFHNEQ